MILIRAVFHAVMILPIIFTATKVWKRHNLLEETIGYLKMEQTSYENITTLFYFAVVIVPVLTILELTFYLLYQCKYHPWRDILAEHEEESSNGNQDTGTGGIEMA